MGSSPAKRALTFPHFPKPIAARCGARPSATQFRVVLGPGRLAQLVRASVLHTEGQRFESSIAHQTRWVLRWISIRAEVAEWQTRYVQDVVSLRVCGFESLLRHQLTKWRLIRD